ncbi:Glycosyl transferase family 2 [Acinetobacter marinus]|uniref:Glycosyl transferase family 2 n=1 Tax=Acinetobacter marinus TaxID=281375 RepID=A0A1G6L0G1_9GAMM|nr:glycosyltransferase family A protein [Acinetobacter marinus]SDC36849.1 Glycosyl transferase family 2 [Acinetobacter marinus]
MFSQFRAYSSFKKSKYVAYLSLSKQWKHSSNEKVLWALYQLGMYNEVNLKREREMFDVQSKYTLIAIIVSAFACGQDIQGEEFIQKYERLFSQDMTLLVEKLATFNYNRALLLAKTYRLTSLCVVALMEKSGDVASAKVMLQNLNTSDSSISNVDKSILMANLSIGVCDKLASLNAIYASAQMSKICLENDNKSNLNVNTIQPCSDEYQRVQPSRGVVSIIMTAFNAKDYIETAVESILKQSYRFIELIIVDDCSTDGTWDIIQSFAKKDQRVRPMRQILNAGTYLAKNKALLMAKGDFVMCHDADDWSHPQRLERQLQPLLEDKKLIATVSNWVRLTNQGRFVSRSVFPLSRLNPSSLLFRRTAVMKKVGFWDAVRTGADSEFNHRVKLAFGHHRVKKVNLPLAIGSFHEKSLMNAPETGFVDQRIPVDRQMYWESWMHWHIDVLRNKGSFYLPIISSYAQRKFEAPEKILPNESVLKEVARSIQH